MAVTIWQAALNSLAMAFFRFLDTLWPLVLGFGLSGAGFVILTYLTIDKIGGAAIGGRPLLLLEWRRHGGGSSCLERRHPL